MGFYRTQVRSDFASGCESDSESGSSGFCCACPEGTECAAPGSTIEALIIEKRYWRQSATTAQVVECDHAPACKGTAVLDDDDWTADGSTDEETELGHSGDELCHLGYKGPQCGCVRLGVFRGS